MSEGCTDGRRRMGQGFPRRLYNEATRGRLASFLNQHPEYESIDIALELSDDFHYAVSYGDVGLAATAVHAASEILNRLGKPEEALDLQIDLIRFQLDTAGTAEEYMAIRSSALAIGFRAHNRGLLTAQAACWLLAVEGAHRLVSTTRPGDREGYLLAALRDLADIAELMCERPLNEPLQQHRARLVGMLAALSAEAYAAQWREETLLGLHAVLKRAARATRWMISRESIAEIYPDAREAQAAKGQLLRLFREMDS
jgi:hypothetical protein